MNSTLKIPKFCEHCGTEFMAKTYTTRYCSHTCNRKHYKVLKRAERVETCTQEHVRKINAPKIAEHQTIQHKAFLSVDEAALLLGASKRTIFRLVASNKLKIAKIGRRTIIKRTDVDQLFND